MTYLLDTCILSKLCKIKVKPDPILERWSLAHKEWQFYVSALTLGEIQQGIYRLGQDQGRRVLEEWFYGHLIPGLKGRILPIDQAVSLKWGEISGSYQRQDIIFPLADALIASTGIVNDLIIVTENIKDFSKIKEAKVFSPWEDS